MRRAPPQGRTTAVRLPCRGPIRPGLAGPLRRNELLKGAHRRRERAPGRDPDLLPHRRQGQPDHALPVGGRARFEPHRAERRPPHRWTPGDGEDDVLGRPWSGARQRRKAEYPGPVTVSGFLGELPPGEVRCYLGHCGLGAAPGMRRMSSSAFRERSFATWLSRWRSGKAAAAPPGSKTWRAKPAWIRRRSVAPWRRSRRSPALSCRRAGRHVDEFRAPGSGSDRNGTTLGVDRGSGSDPAAGTRRACAGSGWAAGFPAAVAAATRRMSVQFRSIRSTFTLPPTSGRRSFGTPARSKT